MPSSVDWPVPKWSLNRRSVRASLTAITGHASRPSASSARSRTSPVVVSSVPPTSPSSSSGRAACRRVRRSAPSSSVTCGAPSTTATTPAAKASASSPRRPCTAQPSADNAATTSSCVVSGLAAASATSAPPAANACTRHAVSAVTCRQAPTRRPASGRSEASRSRIDRRTGICPSAQSIRARPCPTSALSELVAIVVRLVRALDRDADVGGLLRAQLGQLRAERAEVQPRDLLVEVLGQHVDLLLVVLVLREQLDLGDRLVRERRRHHEARVAGRVAEVQQPALRQHDDRVAVGEDPLVDLRLDVDLLDAVDPREPGHV